ncbi:MAG: response regulator, partial [Verrucomicrobiota bacterium]
MSELNTSNLSNTNPLPKGSETIVFVEDEDMIRKLSHRVLHSLGYEVITATDGAIALELVKEFPERIDLILSDVVMPNVRGPEFVSRARKIRDDFKVLYTTGHSIDAALGDAFQETPDERHAELLQKPYTPQQLASRVRKVLDEECVA